MTVVLQAVVVSKYGPRSTPPIEQLVTGVASTAVVVQVIAGPVPLCGTLAGHIEVGT